MRDLQITPYAPRYKQPVIDLTIAAWTPVFAKTETEVPRFAFDAFYPTGWQDRQSSDVTDLLDNEPENIWLAVLGDALVGFLGLRFHPEDQMGEIYILAVSPRHQRQGVGRELMQFAEAQCRDRGLAMVMVETVDDTGHAPARRAYEAFGFERWPVARFFKKL